MNSTLRFGLKDIVDGARAREVWWALALDAIAVRYARTVLGPFWLVLGQAIWVGAIVLVFSYSFGQAPATYAPYVAAGFAAWMFISSSLVDASLILQREKPTIEAFDLPMSVYLYAAVAEKCLILAHHMTIYLVCVVLFSAWPGVPSLLIIPAAAIYIIAALGVSMMISVLGSRFRDIYPALQSLTSLVFILTPIFWDRSMFASRSYVVDWNPFYHFIEIMRAPLLGSYPVLLSWVVSAGGALLLLAMGVAIFSRNRRYIFYWI